MCSACLTPVYPVEKIVVNKVTLHYKCFYCKHCKKKLSTHNYSSLYGEFYCISHYQQLFKRKGNYDEGFGHTQHKDLWLYKDKGLVEPDAKSTSKFTKSILNTSADVVITKVSTRELGTKTDANVKGRLKISWPPEKQKVGVNPAQATNAMLLKNKLSDIDKAATESVSKCRKTVQIGETRDKAVKEQSKITSLSLSEKMPSETPSPIGHFQITISTKESNVSLTSSGNDKSVKNTVQSRKKPISKSNKMEASQNKHRKSVRFAPDVDVSQIDQSCQLGSDDKKEMVSNQFEKIPNDQTDMSDNTEVDFSSTEQNEREGNLEISKCKLREETDNTPNQELDADSFRSQKVPQTDVGGFTTPVVEVNGSLDSQSLTETFVSTADTVKQQELSEKLDIISRDPIIKNGSENLNDTQTPAGRVTEEEVSDETNESPLVTISSVNGQKKPVARTNSQTKKGSWSKGKSPLSKLFMSSGNDKTAKSEPKDAKKPEVKQSGGFLGRLFQSSSDIAKPPEINDKTHNDDKNEKKKKQNAQTEEKQKKENMPEGASLEPDNKNHIKSESSEPDLPENNCRSTDPINHESMAETELGLITPGETDKSSTSEKPKLQGSVASDLSVSDPEIHSEGPPSDVNLLNAVQEESISQIRPEKSTDENLNNPFNYDILGEDLSPAFGGEVPIQMNIDGFSPKPNKPSDPQDETGGNLISDGLFDLTNEHQDFSKCSDSSSIPIQTFSSSVGDPAEPAAIVVEDFSLVDSEPVPAVIAETGPPNVHDSEPINQDNFLDPFGAISQTSEQTSDFDIFGPNDNLFFQLPTMSDQSAADAPTNHVSAFPDDIFGASDVSNSVDVFTLLPSSPATSVSLNDLLGSDTPSTAQVLFSADDIIAPDVQAVRPSEARNANIFGDSLLVSEDMNAEQKSENSSWMDDLLG